MVVKLRRDPRPTPDHCLVTNCGWWDRTERTLDEGPQEGTTGDRPRLVRLAHRRAADRGVRAGLLRATAIPHPAQSVPYYAEFLSGTDLDTVLGTHSASYPDISLFRGDDDISPGEYTNGAGRILPLDIARQFDDGATVMFRQIQKLVPTLARLCVVPGRRFSSRVQTNVYLTPPDAQGFAPHWDTHDVFVLQISGKKRWLIYDTKVRLPLRDQRFESGTAPGDVSEEFELGPGSAVYRPRGLMHLAQSTNQTSLHITLGLTPSTWAALLVESVTAAALEEESLRRNLPREFAREGFPVAERERLFGEKLAFLQSSPARSGGCVEPIHGRDSGQRRAAAHRPVQPAVAGRPADPGLASETPCWAAHRSGD